MVEGVAAVEPVDEDTTVLTGEQREPRDRAADPFILE
jgi:hypothetical protein